MSVAICLKIIICKKLCKDVKYQLQFV